MCGIAGFVDASRSRDDETLVHIASGMADVLRHRGPDDGAVWVDARAGIGLCHRRLALVDLSPDGRQPMATPDDRFVLVFNGEIYNHPQLRRELDGCYAFRGRSDTEVLLAGISVWGVRATLDKLVGMFAFGVWDRRSRTLCLARDRLGEKPLYYGWSGGAFLFGSELKALRMYPGWCATLDRAAVTAYMRHGYVPAPHSIFEGINKLPAGCLVTLRDFTAANLPQPEPYWSLRTLADGSSSHQYGGDETDAVVELERLLREVIGGQMIADVPVGALLSGGIDSSTIVAIMQDLSATPVKTFTIGVDDRSLDEASAARAVARHLGTDHTDVYVTAEDARALVPRLPQVYDEPFADSSQIPTMLIAQLARRQVKAVVAGDGGDELFGGYARYLRGPRMWGALSRLPAPVRSLIGRTLAGSSAQGHVTAVGGARAHGSVTPALGALPERLVRLGEAAHHNSIGGVHRALLSSWPRPARLVLGGWERPTPMTEDANVSTRLEPRAHMLFLDGVMYLPDDLLVKVDRAAMAVGLETRLPLLDHRVVEFAWRLPMAMRVHEGETKRLLRRLLYTLVPRPLVDRPKQGFAIPMGDWLRGPLREWASDLLSHERLAREGVFDAAPIQRKWREHVSARRNWSYHLWTVLMFQAWRAESSTTSS